MLDLDQLIKVIYC